MHRNTILISNLKIPKTVLGGAQQPSLIPPVLWVGDTLPTPMPNLLGTSILVPTGWPKIVSQYQVSSQGVNPGQERGFGVVLCKL